MITDETRGPTRRTNRPGYSSSEDEEEELGPEITEMITHRDRWALGDPKLIISVVYDIDRFFVNQRILKSIMFDLAQVASVEGKTTAKQRTIAETNVVMRNSVSKWVSKKFDCIVRNDEVPSRSLYRRFEERTIEEKRGIQVFSKTVTDGADVTSCVTGVRKTALSTMLTPLLRMHWRVLMSANQRTAALPTKEKAKDKCIAFI